MADSVFLKFEFYLFYLLIFFSLIVPLLQKDGILRRNADVDGPLNSLIDARIATEVVAEK